MDAEGILEELKRYGVSHDRIAAAIGRDRTAATKMMNGVRAMKTGEMPALIGLILEAESAAGESALASAQASSKDNIVMDYVQVEVLPTYAGMGGGGSGDADPVIALLPRSLVEDELRAKPSDLLVINVRGNSMEPLFQHGDQLVIDRRDTSPVQPGPFALWFDDGYVVKNVEVLRRQGKLRIFSTNPIYSDDVEDPENVTIMGRPVWFARRL